MPIISAPAGAGAGAGELAFTNVFGSGRGLGVQHSLLATRPEPRAQQLLCEHDADLSLDALVSDINLMRAHFAQLQSYPALMELYTRLPARLARMVWHDTKQEVEFLLSALAGNSANTIIAFATTNFAVQARAQELMSSRADFLFAQTDDVCLEEVWAAALDALEHAFAHEVGPKIAGDNTVSVLTCGLGDYWAQAQLRYGRETLSLRFHEGVAARALALRIAREGVCLCYEARHAHEAVWDALVWVMEGRAEIEEQYMTDRDQ
jgi:hypothetical protein